VKKVLVTYATQHHSTEEIAQVIGEELKKAAGVEVEIQSVTAAKHVDSYDAVVLGSAVYMGQWRPEAAQFLQNHEQTLAGRPVWLFSSGPTGRGDPKALLDGWTFPEALQPIAKRIAPRDIMVFHGKLIPDKLTFFQRFITRMVKASVGDFRDWNMIRTWAGGIAQAL
jgi:menaquinone-dependent protoporphyrinogen oxidase